MESVCLPGSPLSADELRQGLPGVSKVARWKPSLASQTAPQSDESGRVAGEPHGSQSVSKVDRKKLIGKSLSPPRESFRPTCHRAPACFPNRLSGCRPRYNYGCRAFGRTDARPSERFAKENMHLIYAGFGTD